MSLRAQRSNLDPIARMTSAQDCFVAAFLEMTGGQP